MLILYYYITGLNANMESINSFFFFLFCFFLLLIVVLILVEWWQFHAAESQTIPTLTGEETGPVIKGLF